MKNIEEVDVSCVFKINKSNKQLLQEALQCFSSEQILKNKDTLTLSYEFTIEYLYGIKDRLEMLCKLWDAAENKSLSFKTMTNAKVLSFTIFKLCDKLLKKTND